MTRHARTLPALVVWFLLFGAAAAPGLAENVVRVVIESPAPGVTVEGHVHQAQLSGRAAAAGERPEHFDVIVAIDVSYSTTTASGLDVDRDGIVGVNPHNELLPPGAYDKSVRSTDPGDTILAAQVQAANALLESLDPDRVRVGVISFSGEVDPITARRKRLDQEDARLEVPLTADFQAVGRALGAVLARGARGATNYAAGIRIAIRELAGLSGAKSQPREGVRRVILFLSDGSPTLPVGRGDVVDDGDKEAAIRAAELAHRAGISINAYALGPAALRYPKVMTEISRVSLGTYTPVQRPGQIVTLLQGITFANVEDIVFTNLTTGDFSSDVRLSPDGGFTGFVPVAEGMNRVRVTALATDGSRGSVEFDLMFARATLPDRDAMAELDRIRKQNKQLEIRRMDMEIEAFRDEQRKQLKIDVERRKEE
ncbi:MAG: VWA domain-containing protein [Deltaproteobacteria bacterium]|nr:VWA domain-containing protein [Deltaproteobacteria bacterium]MBW2393063.1 VWA domain-containing protein [Deltaproteobacteria bacterium]